MDVIAICCIRKERKSNIIERERYPRPGDPIREFKFERKRIYACTFSASTAAQDKLEIHVNDVERPSNDINIDRWMGRDDKTKHSRDFV